MSPKPTQGDGRHAEDTGALRNPVVPMKKLASWKDDKTVGTSKAKVVRDAEMSAGGKRNQHWDLLRGWRLMRAASSAQSCVCPVHTGRSALALLDSR